MLRVKILISLLFMAFCLPVFSDEMFKSGVTASFYADKFHGRKTASGEKFNMYDYTAAHKTLPFGTVLKVTNLANGKSVNVRVNDRGPFAKGREIDLSKAAAVDLDMIDEGTATVSLVIVTDATKEVSGTEVAKKSSSKQPEAATKQAVPATKQSVAAKAAEVAEKARKREEQVSSLLWDVQIGAYGKKSNAENMAKRLTEAGFDNVVFQKGPSVIRVVLHDIKTDDVQQTLVDLEKAGFTDYFVRDSAD